jgi:beta-N-acetylhexosaminidase
MKKPILNEMTLREKIAQTMLVRQRDVRFKNVYGKWIERTPEETYDLIEKNQFGGMWVLGNFKLDFEGLTETESVKKPHSDEYKEWVEEVSRALKIPLLVGIDARNGVNQFYNLTSTCGALNIGACDSEELAYSLCNAVSQEIRSCGANWHWYPVADMPSRFSAGFGRSVSDDPDKIIKLNKALIRGMNDANVASTIKHFPGADPYEYRDSHAVTRTISLTLEEWKEKQGRVFKELIDSGVYSVMTAHAIFPDADDTKIGGRYLPASLSKKIIIDLLKEEMGFKGVVVTDSIGMTGVMGYYSKEQLLVELLKAGNDVLLGAGIDGVDIVERAVLSGELSEERINDACQRILDMKEKIGIFNDDYSIGINITSEILNNTRKINEQVADESVTLLCDYDKKLPLDKSCIKKVTIIISTHKDFIVNKLETMKAEFEKRGARVYMQRRLATEEELKKLDEKSDLIIYAAYLGPHAPRGLISFYDDEFTTFTNALVYGKEKSIGVSLGNPYIYYNFLANIDTFINIYSYSDENQKAFVKTLYGELPLESKSPVDLSTIKP